MPARGAHQATALQRTTPVIVTATGRPASGAKASSTEHAHRFRGSPASMTWSVRNPDSTFEYEHRFGFESTLRVLELERILGFLWNASRSASSAQGRPD